MRIARKPGATLKSRRHR